MGFYLNKSQIILEAHGISLKKKVVASLKSYLQTHERIESIFQDADELFSSFIFYFYRRAIFLFIFFFITWNVWGSYNLSRNKGCLNVIKFEIMNQTHHSEWKRLIILNLINSNAEVVYF